MDSKLGNQMRKIVVKEWEKVNGRTFNRRQVMYERKLQDRVSKGLLTAELAGTLIAKSRKTNNIVEVHDNTELLWPFTGPLKVEVGTGKVVSVKKVATPRSVFNPEGNYSPEEFEHVEAMMKKLSDQADLASTSPAQ